MGAHTITDGQQANRRYLAAALAVVRRTLERHASSVEKQPCEEQTPDEDRQELETAAVELQGETPLQTICTAFNLTPFERAVLLLCAGVELDSSFADLCVRLQPGRQPAEPTFSLALAALPDAHWSAVSPASPLRYWRLIEVGKGTALTLSPLRIDERILHYLTGLQYPDERLAGVVEPAGESDELVPSQLDCAERIARIWAALKDESAPVFQLCGDSSAAKRDVAAAVCAVFGLELWVLPARNLPASPQELDLFRRLWEREAALAPRALLLDCDQMEAGNSTEERNVNHLIEHLSGPLLISTARRRPPLQRFVPAFDVEKPRVREQRAVWRNTLGSAAGQLGGHIERLIFQFDMNAAAIRSAHADAIGRAAGSVPNGTTPEAIGASLWESCRVQARPRLDDIVQRIESAAAWRDLVLPERQIETLHDMALQVRERATVYGAWGFSAKGERGLGIAALFAGPSGTGKTLAAEVLADELRLDLYRIDLSTVVNKYIGETEKNLRRVFDSAEAGGAILLFDEADALFGKRSEVRDSHDRYANIEVGYLLQRMEAYRGLAILTTNLKDNLDQAFLRRLRFIVQFPFPDAALRTRIWERVFPAETPTEGLDAGKLARLNVAGGDIRNIALHAAFLAARDAGPVTMGHLRRAARSEYAKLERPLTDAEIRGWE
ncbi:MAG TPA: ATP-binding protein [Bryobacteraceae bacterium]|nr:ATP-binding protein [Bryobacteraceae bacterium]